MFNFSAISDQSFYGRVLRIPLKLIPRDARIPVLQGPLRGLSWCVASSNHGCWLGSYEAEKQELFAKLVKPGDVVYDIGANVGFYSLLAAKSVGAQGRVYAFEPLPKNLEFLKKHIELNRFTNVEISPGAVGKEEGKALFEEHPSTSMGKLSSAGSLEVNVVAIDSLMASGQIKPPNLLKIDVEGGEEGVLLGAKEVIRKYRPVILLATHGPGPHENCCRLLREWSYKLQPINASTLEQADEVLATSA